MSRQQVDNSADSRSEAHPSSLRAAEPRALAGVDLAEAGTRRNAFLARLSRMSAEERLRAARYAFTPWERDIWAGRFPDEVPLVNGEYEWIALTLADLD
jgi:hypothetical protein